jgi:hypothetical protein
VWLLCKWTAGLAVVVAIALGFYLYHRLDDEVRLAVETKLAGHYPKLKVSVREAQLLRGEGIRIRGLSIVEPNRSGPEEQLLFVEELFIHCGTDPRDLIKGKLVDARYTLRKPVLRATRKPDGGWSAAQLLPIPKFGDTLPSGEIEGGTLELVDPLERVPAKFALREAILKWSPAEGPVPPDGKRQLRFIGRATGAHLRTLTLDALVDPTGGAWSLSGTVDRLDLSPDMLRTLPGPLAANCTAVAPLRAKVQAVFQASYAKPATPEAAAKFDYDVDGAIVEGRIEDARLPYPVSDLTCKFRLNPAGLRISDLAARHGAATLKIDLEQAGLGTGKPMRITASGERLVLDARMLELMPEQWRTQWNNFQPAGTVDLDVALTYDGTAWRPEMRMRCLDVSFAFHKFPYRLDHGRGEIVLKDKRLTVVMAAMSNTEEVKLNGEYQLDGPRTTGWTEIRADGIQVDERLLEALPAANQALAHAMHPQGRFNVSMKVWKDDPNDPVMHKHAVFSLRDGSVQYDKFPYPIRAISGTVEVLDDRWTFHDDLRGVNDTARISCRGESTPLAEGGVLTLAFHGENVPIDDELRDALNPGARRLWNDMKPRGMLELDSQVRLELQEKKLDVWVRARPVGDTVSIEPTYFPYRFEKLAGTFTFHDNRLQMEGLQAEHGRARVAAEGSCGIDPAGGWRLDLTHLFVDRLVADRDLLNALPEALRKSTASLEPTGSFNVRGSLGMAGGGEPGAPISAEWNVTFDCQNNTLQCGVPLSGVHGSLWLAGRSAGGRFESSGELQLDSVNYGNHQFTEVLGPIWIDNQQVLLGFWADRRGGNKTERHLTGKLYGGSTVADGWVVLGDEPEYALLAKLTGGNLAQFAQENMPGSGRLSGEILATVDLRGRGKTRNNLTGRGTVQLRNADIYQLPAMVSLLKVLSLRNPDATAFTQSDITFVLQAEHVYLERIDFAGDAVSLQGSGYLNLMNDQVKLKFRTVLGNDAGRLTAVKQLLGGASQQILLLHVDGPMTHPQVRREAFPGVSQMLDQLQSELRQPSPPPWQDGTDRVAPPGRLP